MGVLIHTLASLKQVLYPENKLGHKMVHSLHYRDLGIL